MVNKKCLPRRTFLRAAGATLALPLLDAMTPAMTAVASTVAAPKNLKRLSFVYMPMGSDITRWTPGGNDGTLKELSPSLQSLESVKDHCTVVSNLELKNAYPGTHATSNASFLSAARAKRTESTDYYLGTTVVAMDMLQVVGQCDNGYACVYQNNLSWASPTTPLPAEAHPRLVFETLFGDGSTADERRRSLVRRASLLDGLTNEVRRLKNTLGPEDKHRIDGYLASIREVERRIEQAEKSAKENEVPDIDRPTGVPASYAEHARLMFDLQLLAMQGDITRVTTFQLARETSNRTYNEIGISDPHHPLTHHGNDPKKIAKVAKINAFHVSLFAEFLEKLKATKEGEGTLLDNALLLYGSGMGNPNVHDHTNLPIIVAGGSAGDVKGNRHLKFDEPTPLANLHLSLLNKVGVQCDQFADSDGPLDDLFGAIDL